MMTHIPNSPGENSVQTAKSNHTLSVDRRRHASITGVADVCSFQESEIVLKIDSSIMVICGQSLHIAKLLLDDGRLDIDGHIDSIIYETPKKQTRRILNWKWRKK